MTPLQHTKYFEAGVGSSARHLSEPHCCQLACKGVYQSMLLKMQHTRSSHSQNVQSLVVLI